MFFFRTEVVILNKFSPLKLKETYKSGKGNMLFTTEISVNKHAVETVELTDFRMGSDHLTFTSSPARKTLSPAISFFRFGL